MTGTAAHVTPILEIDSRPVNGGGIGVVSAQLQQLFFDAILGRLPQYERWLIPIPSADLVGA